nr:Protein ZK1307.7, isoform b [Haemonchus contortus]
MCYVPVILVDSLKDWLNSVLLASLWWSYFVYLLGLTHVTMTAASFVLICALYERYLITIRSPYLKRFQRHRGTACVISFLVALVTKGGIFLELDIFPDDDESCQQTVNEFYVDMTAINSKPLYGTVYRFWIRNIVTVFVPFFLLTLINFKTLVKLKAQLKQAKIDQERRFSMRCESKSKVRSATWTLLLVCLLYLLANLPNVIVTAWEFIDMKSLQTEFYAFYMFSTDLVSLLVVAACAMRMPIYMLCNPELRRVITHTLRLQFMKPNMKQCKSEYL